MIEATLSLYEPELDIMAYDEAADRSVTIAVMGDELTPSERKHYAELIVREVNSHDALIAALEAVEWAVPTPDADNDGSCPSCYAGKPVKYYVVSTKFDRKNHMRFCQLADALEQVK
jgi:hypothetical protein